MASIHESLFRMALFEENRLQWRSNLRLLANAHNSNANKWYSNAIFLFCVILSYAAPSMIFLDWNPELAAALDVTYHDPIETNLEDYVHVSGVAWLFLAFGLLGQAAIITWALATVTVSTWSSNPLDLVFILGSNTITTSNTLKIRKGRSMISVHEKCEDLVPRMLRSRQGLALTAHPYLRVVLACLWLLVPLGALWGGINFPMIRKGNRHGILGRSWMPLPQFTGRLLQSCGAAMCTDGASVLNIGWTSRSGPTGMVGTVFPKAAFQSTVTLALHCTELIVDVLQDEETLRSAVAAKSTNPITAICKLPSRVGRLRHSPAPKQSST